MFFPLSANCFMSKKFFPLPCHYALMNQETAEMGEESILMLTTYNKLVICGKNGNVSDMY